MGPWAGRRRDVCRCESAERLRCIRPCGDAEEPAAHRRHANTQDVVVCGRGVLCVFRAFAEPPQPPRSPDELSAGRWRGVRAPPAFAGARAPPDDLSDSGCALSVANYLLFQPRANTHMCFSGACRSRPAGSPRRQSRLEAMRTTFSLFLSPPGVINPDSCSHSRTSMCACCLVILAHGLAHL